MPPNIVTNEYLASTLELLEEEIVKRTGIEERRYVDSGTSCSELALHAVENAVHRSGLFQEIDLIIFATLSPDHFFPGSGCFLQASETSKRTGARHPQRGFLGSAALGMAFAAGWTPCIGPILGGIIGLAATSGGWRSGLVLSAFYSAGLAVPFLLTGLGISLLSFGEKTPPPAPAPANTNFEPAPDVEFQTLAGQPFRLKDAYQEEVAKFEYQVLLGGSDAKVKYAQSVLPTTYLIDRQGRIRQKIIGARDKAGWEAAVKPLLAETPATASAN